MASKEKKLLESKESLKTMGSWKKRKLLKGMRASRESGKKKGLCPDSLARWMCRASRSYKHPQYEVVMAKLGTRKKAK